MKAGEPYLFDMGGGFTPFRRDVEWLDTSPAPILPLLERLELTRGNRNWGYAFRFGIVRITDGDADIIVEAMASKEGAQIAAA